MYLKKYFLQKILKTQEEQKYLQSRLEEKSEISNNDQAAYYGNYINALIHIALTIDEFRTREKIAQRLSLPLATVDETLFFLTSCKLAKEQNGVFTIDQDRIHLDRESKFVTNHHINWRIKTLENLNLATKNDFHYSSIVSFGYSDWPKLREILVSAMEEIQKIIKDSPSQELFVLTSDLFQLKK